VEIQVPPEAPTVAGDALAGFPLPACPWVPGGSNPSSEPGVATNSAASLNGGSGRLCASDHGMGIVSCSLLQKHLAYPGEENHRILKVGKDLQDHQV